MRSRRAEETVVNMEGLLGNQPPPPPPESPRPASSRERFESASAQTRLFLCLGRTLQAKKTCALILVLVLILVVEFTKLFLPAGSVAGQQLQASADRGLDLARQVFEVGPLSDVLLRPSSAAAAANLTRA